MSDIKQRRKQTLSISGYTLPPLYPNQSCGHHIDCFIENLIVSIICTLYLGKQKRSSFRGSNKIISRAVNHAAPTHGGVSPLSRQSRAGGRGGVWDVCLDPVEDGL